jgi:hypothetical protein
MTDAIEMIDPVTGEIIDQQQIAEQLLAQAKEQGVSLVGPGGLLGNLTKTVLETALEAELTADTPSASGPYQFASHILQILDSMLHFVLGRNEWGRAVLAASRADGIQGGSE